VIGPAAVVDIGPVKKLARPVTLAEVKADPAFKTFALVRISRLSVMPVTDAEWTRIEAKAGK
jgi:predicted RNA-binding protein with PUA-like domain